MTETAAESGGDGTYSGLLGAFPYAFRASESRLFRSYAVLGGLLAVAIAIMFSIAVIVQLGESAGTPGGVFTFARAFVIFVGLLVAGPLLAPVLAVARHHRRVGADARYDVALALAGYAFVFSLYLALVISTPPARQTPVSGALAPAVEFMYALPQLYGLVPPTLGAAGIYLAHRLTR